jgi:uncharacterized membrane protein
MNRLMQLWNEVRTSFWFTPAVMVAASIAFAIAMIELESHVSESALARWPKIFGAGAEGARQMLSTIASSMMAVVGITYSMTLVTLSLASSQYTPRILRNFMANRIMQLSLGMFVGIFAYCLIVLRTVRGGEEAAFIPHIAVAVSFLMALAGVVALIVFIHHVATSIQASSIVATIADETRDAVIRLFPEPMGQAQEVASTDMLEAELRWHPVPTNKSGYIQSIDEDRLVHMADEMQLLARMERSVGEFVTAGEPLLSVSNASAAAEEDATRLLRCYSVGRHRTVWQDPGFGVRQLVDIALKALSPGVNDTTTAVSCVNYLSTVLAEMATRKLPPQVRTNASGRSVVLAVGPTFGTLLKEAFDPIRANAGGNPDVIAALLRSLRTIGARLSDPERKASVEQALRSIEELIECSIVLSHDRKRLEKEFAVTLHTIKSSAVEQRRNSAET